MRDKLLLTQKILQEVADRHHLDLDTAMSTWWYNIRKNGGMRLTTEGYLMLKNVADLACYDLAIDPKTFGRQMILALDRKLQMPYYIEVKKKIPCNIVFFGSREAMLARLYGDLARFLTNY